MKRIVSSLSAFALAFSLFGVPATAFANQSEGSTRAFGDESTVAEAAADQAEVAADGLPDDTLGPIMKDEAPDAADAEEPKDPVYNDEAESAQPIPADTEDPSLLDAIIGFFTGGNDASEEDAGQQESEAPEPQDAEESTSEERVIHKDRAAAASSVEVTLRTAFPNAVSALAGAGSPLTLIVDGTSVPFAAAGAAGTLHTATVANVAPGTHAVTVSGANHIPLSFQMELNAGSKHAFTLVDAVDAVEREGGHDAGYLPYGDLDGNGMLDDEDSRLLSEAYVQQSTDPAFDLSADGFLTLKDIQLLTASKGRSAQQPGLITETPDSSQTDPVIPEGTSVLLDGAVVTGADADAALRLLTESTGHVVGLTAGANTVPDAKKIPVSAESPVTLALNANGVTMDRITLYAPVVDGAGASMPLEGTLRIAFERDGEDHWLDIPLPCESAFETSDPSLLPYVSASVQPAAGYAHFSLGENVKVYDLAFTFTKAAGPDDTLVQLTRVAYAATGLPGPDEPGPDEPEPAPLPTIPEGLTVTTNDRLIEASWDAALNAVGYEVELSTGVEEPEILTTTQPRLQVRTFADAPLENDVTYRVRVRSINEEDAKSDWGPATYATPQLRTPPVNPSDLTLKAGYQEITASWNEVERADYYTLTYAKQGGAVIGTIETQDTKRTVRDLENETAYTFTVTAHNEYGSSSPVQATARTTFVTTKVPWFGLINRTVQDPEAFLPSDAFKSVTAAGSEEEGVKLVDGNYNTACQLTDGERPTWNTAAKVVFNQAHSLREMALSTNLGEGYADGIEDVVIRTTSGRSSATFSAKDGLTWEPAPTRDGSTEVATNTIMVTLPNVVANVDQVEIIIYRTDDAAFTLSELAFYEATTFQESINALFKHGSLNTELAEGVTEEAILQMRDLLNVTDDATDMPPNDGPERYWGVDDLMEQLNVAYALLESQNARIVTTHPEIHGSASELQGANAWQPLGAVAAAGTTVQVHVTPATPQNDVTPGDATKLRLTYVQHHGAATDLSSLGYLALGVNTFTIPQLGFGTERGGALYVEYEEAGCPAYQVKVTSAQEVPLLDVFGMSSNQEIKQACMAYAADLDAYATTLRTLHGQGGHTGAYAEQLCIANATEVLTSRTLISVPATLMQESFQEAMANNGVQDGASALAAGLPLTDKMVNLIYQQAGLFDVADPQNAATVAAYGQDNALPTMHLNFRYQRADGGMQVTANSLGLEWAQAVGVGTAPNLQVKPSGLYKTGALYGWDLSQLVGRAVASDGQTFPLVLADYYAQLVTSKDNDVAGEDTGLRFSHDDVQAYLASPTGGKLDALPKNLGLAVLWQLHLAYDEGYSYTMFEGADALMDGSLFARMNAYVRNPGAAPAGLVLEGADADNAFMRLACAASGKDLMAFFDAWGLPANADTRAYAATFPAETRPITYISDESHNGARQTAQADVQQVAATVQASGPNEEGEVLISGIALKEGVRASANLGYEVLRQVGEDADTSQVVGFVPVGNSTFIDRLTTDNGQTLQYAVRAVDTALNRSAATEAGEVQAAFPRNLNKAYWTVTSTMESSDDPTAMVDGSVATAFAGTHKAEANGTLGGVATDGSAYASVTIAFGKPTDACGIRYFPGSDVQNAFRRLWVQVSDDGVNWTSVGYKEVGETTFAASKCATVYFTESMVMPSAAASETAQVSVQTARYLRVTDLDATPGTRSVAELDVIGSLPDEVVRLDADGNAALIASGSRVEG